MCTAIILRLELITNHLSGWQMFQMLTIERGRWFNTLQDFSFKIVHQAREKHINIGALSHNPVDVVDEWKYLIEEIQDCKLVGLSSTLAKTIWIG